MAGGELAPSPRIGRARRKNVEISVLGDKVRGEKENRGGSKKTTHSIVIAHSFRILAVP